MKKIKASKTSTTVPVGMKFKIVYRANGMTTIEQITAFNWDAAKAICQQKGYCVKVEHIPEAHDLAYVH